MKQQIILAFGSTDLDSPIETVTLKESQDLETYDQQQAAERLAEFMWGNSTAYYLSCFVNKVTELRTKRENCDEDGA